GLNLISFKSPRFNLWNRERSLAISGLRLHLGYRSRRVEFQIDWQVSLRWASPLDQATVMVDVTFDLLPLRAKVIGQSESANLAVGRFVASMSFVCLPVCFL